MNVPPWHSFYVSVMSLFFIQVFPSCNVLLFTFHVKKEAKAPELEKDAVQAVQDLYDVVRHDILSVNMRSC